MATITFENGKKVKFEGNPTPADIDFVAKQMGIGSSPEPKPTGPTTVNKLSKTPVIGQLSNAGIGIGSKLARTAVGIPEGMSRLLGKASSAIGLEGLGQSFEKNAQKIGATGDKLFVKPFQGSLDTTSGKIGTVTGSVIPYVVGGGAVRAMSLGPRILAGGAIDAGIAGAQTGGDPTSMAVAGITGGASSALPVVKGVQGFKPRALKLAADTAPGYVSDVVSGVAGQRGEDRTGASAFIPGMGTLLGAGVGAASQVAGSTAKYIAGRKDRIAKEFDNTVGQVLQGKSSDISTGKRAFSHLETDGISTYKDLRDRANEKIEIFSNKLDEALETNPNPKLLDNLDLETSVGGQVVKHNYVTEALDQLDDFYSKTNNPNGRAQIAQIRAKAKTQGLTVKEVNDIARTHGEKLSAYNLNGELASGLTKQAAENTRNGLKATSRSNFGNKASQEADSAIASLIRVRTLAEEMVEKVNKLQQTVTKRGLFEKMGRLFGQVVDLTTGGFLGGATRSLIIPRGGGLKTLNALDIEKRLEKNLRLIREAAEPGASPQTIIKKLEEVIRNNGQKPALLSLPAPSKSKISPPRPPLYVTPKGKVADNIQEASDIAAVETGKVRPPRRGRGRPRRATQPLEPYIPENELPTIK